VRIIPIVMSCEERYRTDAHFKMLADMIEAYIHKTEFTPSEVREAAMMACIHFEMRYRWAQNPFPPRIETKSTAGRLGFPPPPIVIVDGYTYTYERSDE